MQITLKYSDFSVVTRQGPVPATWTTQAIYEAACGLLESNWDRARPVRLIGVALAGLDGEEKEEPVQLSLLDAMPETDVISERGGSDAAGEEKNARLDVAMDQIRRRLGTARWGALRCSSDQATVKREMTNTTGRIQRMRRGAGVRRLERERIAFDLHEFGSLVLRS